MITSVCQRWRGGRATYRPRGEPIRTADYEVTELEGPGSDALARGFVTAHHYSRSYPSARRRFGLYMGEQLVGVAVYSTPVRAEVLRELPARRLSDGRDARVELGRFVLLDGVPANGETWFLARTFELLRREGFAGVISFADPLPRRDVEGRIVHPGHVGTIYQAHNACYVGLAAPRTMLLLPDGTVINRRSLQKLLGGERSRRSVQRQLEAAGAPPLEDGEDEVLWARRAVDRLARRVRHRGNHKYVWAFERADRRSLPKGQPYPKVAPLFS